MKVGIKYFESNDCVVREVRSEFISDFEDYALLDAEDFIYDLIIDGFFYDDDHFDLVFDRALVQLVNDDGLIVSEAWYVPE